MDRFKQAVDLVFRRSNDNLLKSINMMTPRQRGALDAKEMIIILEGGNQSGKSFSAAVDCVAYLLNEHPVLRWDPQDPPDAWYCTTTYPQFGAQPWQHIKKMLFFPGESEHKLPSARVRKIDWIKSGTEPKGIHLQNGSSLYVKSYDQGQGEFMAKTLPYCVVDEECPDKIWTELMARKLATKNPRYVVAATPIQGVEWLSNLRDMSVEGRGNIKHITLPTIENPGHNKEAVAELREQFRDRPEELALRLLGKPYSRQGLVYPDGLWKPDHICKPFEIPFEWARYRCVDYGYNNCACSWLAISPDEENIVMYRDYLGKQRRIKDNVEAITIWERKGERYVDSLIDRQSIGRDQETGKRIIDLYRLHGWHGRPAPDNRLESGIEQCKDLLAKWNNKFDRPVFRVFDNCSNFLRERRSYKWPEDKADGRNEPKERPVKRDDHVLDSWRYLVAAGLKYKKLDFETPMPDPVRNPVGYAFWTQRNPQDEDTL